MSRSRYISDDEEDPIRAVRGYPHGLKRRSLVEDRKKNGGGDIIGPMTTVKANGARRTVSKNSLMRSKANLDRKFRTMVDRRATKLLRGENDALLKTPEGTPNSKAGSDSGDNTLVEIGRAPYHAEYAESRFEREYRRSPAEPRSYARFFEDTLASEDDVPHTPKENEIRTPLVSPGFSIKRRLLVGEVGSRKTRKGQDGETIDALLARAKMNGIRIRSPEKHRYEAASDDDVILDNEEMSRVHDEPEYEYDKYERDSFKENAMEFEEKADRNITSPSRDRKRFSIARRMFAKNGETTANTAEQSEMFYLVSSPVEKGPETPSRMTEAVAVSPRTEQESRIVDDADISLDTSAPPKVVNPASPLREKFAQYGLYESQRLSPLKVSARGSPLRISLKGSPLRRSPERLSPRRYSPERNERFSPKRQSPVRQSPERNERFSPTRQSPARQSPERHSPDRHSPLRANVDHQSPTEKSPVRESPEVRSPTIASPTRTSPAKVNGESSQQSNPLLSLIDQGDELLNDLDQIIRETAEKKGQEVADISFENPAEKPTFLIKQYAKLQSEYNEDLKSLQADMSAKNREISVIQHDLSSSQSRVKELEREVEELQLHQKRLEEQNRVLEQEFDTYQKDIERLQKENADKTNNLEAFSELSEKFRALYKERKAELIELRQLKESNASQIAQLTQERDAHAAKVEYLQERAIKMNNELLEATERVKELEEELLRLRSQHEAADEENYGLKYQIDQVNKEKRDLKGRLESVEATAASETTAKFELENQISDLKDEAGKLRREVKRLESELERLKDDMRVKDLENEQLQRENKDMEEIIMHRNKQLSDYEAQVQEANAKYVSAVKEGQAKLDEVSAANSTNSRLASRVGELCDTVEKLRRSISKRESELRETREALEQTERECKHLEKACEKARSEAREHASAVSKAQSSLQRAEEQHYEELEKIERQALVLQSTVNAKNTELAHMEDNKASLAAENERLEEKLESTQRELTEARKLVSKLRAQHADAERRTEERLKQLSDDLYVQYLQKHTQKVQLLKEGYEKKYSVEFGSVKSENEGLKRDLKELERRLEKERKEKGGLMKLVEKWAAEQAGGRL